LDEEMDLVLDDNDILQSGPTKDCDLVLIASTLDNKEQA
jgi:hypothetical protein